MSRKQDDCNGFTPFRDFCRMYSRHRCPAESISYCVWVYYALPLSYRDIEKMILYRGIEITYESSREWCEKFGQQYANQGTDARAPISLDEALRRGERCLKAGADGIYVEAVHSVEELEKVGKTFSGIPLATTILEGGGKTPWVSPDKMEKLGFSMILYPTTVIFQVTHAIQSALMNLKSGHSMPPKASVTFQDYESMLGLPQWQEIEERYEHQRESRREFP